MSVPLQVCSVAVLPNVAAFSETKTVTETVTVSTLTSYVCALVCVTLSLPVPSDNLAGTLSYTICTCVAVIKQDRLGSTFLTRRTDSRDCTLQV